MLLMVAVIVVLGVWAFAKWNFANALSTQAALKEIANLAVDLAPSDPQTHFSAAAIYRNTFESTDQDRSLAEYERVAALAPYNFLCWLELGSARERNGDAAGAELALRKALDLAPNYANVQWAYGNTLLRAGKRDEGFLHMSNAVASNAVFSGPAVVTAMEIFDGDLVLARQQFPDTPVVNSALAAYLVRQKRFDDALTAWERVPPNLRSSELKEEGAGIAVAFFLAKLYRPAARIFADLSDEQTEKIEVGKVLDGGFESGVKRKRATDFEWLIAEGSEPQIGISQTQKHGGSNSIQIAFNTMQASDFRRISQIVAVEPGATYEFEFFYRSELKTTPTVRWEIANLGDGATIGTTEPVAAVSDWMAIKTKFTMPASADGLIIRLVRDRCPATVCPINGSLWLDDVSIRKL